MILLLKCINNKTTLANLSLGKIYISVRQYKSQVFPNTQIVELLNVHEIVINYSLFADRFEVVKSFPPFEFLNRKIC
jgi:hypothetical protein